MIVVSDASPGIALAAVERLDLLRELFGRIIVPEEVFQEIVAAEDGAPGVREVQAADWIERRAVKEQVLVQALSLELDRGETEAIALAMEMQADLLLMDERRGRKVAARLGLPVLGVLGILVRAKGAGRIGAVRPILGALHHRSGFRVGQPLYDRVLQEVGEAE